MNQRRRGSSIERACLGLGVLCSLLALGNVRAAEGPGAGTDLQSVLLDAVDVLATPGHTGSHHSVRFDCDDLSVVVAGDAVATRDFFRDRRGYFNAVDQALSARTMDALGALADVIVPGHDNCFLVETV